MSLFPRLGDESLEHLPSLLKPASDAISVKEEILRDITGDEDVLFSWMFVTSDFDDESEL